MGTFVHAPDDDDVIRAALAATGLRVTAVRIAVYRALASAQAPLSHKEVTERLGDVDRVTVFRNLLALAEAGLVRRLELGDHTWRFELMRPVHNHAHFTCVTCGEVSCLEDVEIAFRGVPSAVARLASAEVQLRGVCVDCA